MPSVINASTTGSGGVITSGDTSGVLVLQSDGNAVATLSPDKSFALAGSGVTKNIFETANISATAASGTINVDILTSVVWYYTSNASSNWVFNFRGNSTTTLNSTMVTGQSLTVAFLVQQGASPYYATSITIDGVANTPVWQNGTAPSGGVANALEAYIYTIIKTSASTYKVLAQRIFYS